jgi:hypothetical protein
MTEANCRRVNIEPLKLLVARSFGRNSALRQLIQLESDQLRVEEFLALIRTWLRLVDIEAGSTTSEIVPKKEWKEGPCT